jgi:hypothetical protein
MIMVGAAHAATYEWVDKQGVMHFTDDPDKIPFKYRNKARQLDLTPVPGEKEQPPAQPQPRPADETGPAVDKAKSLYGGHNETWWRASFKARRDEVKTIQEALPDKKEKLNASSERMGMELVDALDRAVGEARAVMATLTELKKLGVRIAIDDFGTGFSSLSYLAKLPVDTLKIDRSFVIDMTVGPAGLALVSTIINLAHSLNLKVVAEGVETEEQSRLLRLLRCDEMQGFLFSKPVPGEIFEARYLVKPE